MRHLLAMLVAVQVALVATPLHAADGSGAVAEAGTEAPRRAEVEEALVRGWQMFLYDQAAWHATDRMLADFKGEPDERMRGYLVLPSTAEGRLVTIFYGEINGKMHEMARYEMQGDAVVEGGVISEGAQPPLNPLAERMVAAKAAALDEADARNYERCNASSMNMIILPPDANDVMSVYLLTAPDSNTSYPIGGHYRMDVGADDKIISSRRFLNSCFVAPFSDAAMKSAPEDRSMVFVTHLLDSHPTEIHTFASNYMPDDLVVVTADKLMWAFRQGQLMEVSAIGDVPTSED